MRCRNCGWDNPQDSVKCVKCDQLLDVEGGTFTSAEIVTNVDYNGRKTMSENLVFSGEEESHSPASKPKRRLCFNCKHPILSDYYFCPKCGVDLKDEKNVTENIASNATVSDAGARSTMPDSATKSTVPGDLSRSTLPDSALKSTVPGDLSRSTLPDSALKSIVPGDLSRSTLPDSALKSTIQG
ncbi:MAG: zinc ribbon domain-containing protein, partial [Tannerella sp.]|nr:zinc ribbon domain-containing protein [Tannerella sp.]